jgi:hypothetical protein
MTTSKMKAVVITWNRSTRHTPCLNATTSFHHRLSQSQWPFCLRCVQSLIILTLESWFGMPLVARLHDFLCFVFLFRQRSCDGSISCPRFPTKYPKWQFQKLILNQNCPTALTRETWSIRMWFCYTVRGCNQKIPDWVDNEIYACNNKHSFRCNTKGYDGKIH